MALRCPEELIGNLDTSLLPEGSLSGNSYRCRKPAVLHCSGVHGMTAPHDLPLSYRWNGSSRSPSRFVIIANHLRRPGAQEPCPAARFIPENRATDCPIEQAARAGGRRPAAATGRGACRYTFVEARETFRENRSTRA